jgi:septal ring factor EnvC (AmiA/AmiB activator)
MAQSPAPSQAEALARRAAERIRALQREADGLAARERTMLGDLRRLEVERDLRTEQYNEGAREFARLSADADALSSRIQTLEHRARLQLPDLSSRLVELYKLGNAGYLRMVLNVDDLREAGRAYRFVSAMQAIDRQQLSEHERTLADLRRARTTLVDRQSTQALVQQEMAAARDAAARAAASLSAMLDDIDARRDLNARLVGELQVAAARLQATVTDMADGARHDAAVTLPLRPFKGDLDWPVVGRVAAPFGRQRNARFRTAVTSNGVVIAAAAETPVRAVHEGTVSFAEPFTGFGNLVILDHGNAAFTMYGHLADIDTRAGSRVTRGQVVGTVGPLLDGTTALYFELRIDGKPVDPLQWLRKP